MAIIISSVLLAGYGYKVFTDISIQKKEDAAYEKGVNNASTTNGTSLEKTIRLKEDDLKNLLLEVPNNRLPKDVILSDVILNGWALPRGNETHGRADISMCYIGGDLSSRKTAHAFLVSNNAQAESPDWRVDILNVTDEPCSTITKEKDE